MDTKRMIVNIHECIVDESTSTDWDELRIQDYDVTEIMIEVIGEDPDGSRVAAFIAEPWEFPEVGEMLMQDPEINFSALLDPGFSLAEFLNLDPCPETEDCALEWARWRTGVTAGADRHAWRRVKWEKRAEDISEAISKDEGQDVPSDVYLPLMQSLVVSRPAVQAFVDALRDWKGEPLEGMRTIAAVIDGLQNGRETD